MKKGLFFSAIVAGVFLVALVTWAPLRKQPAVWQHQVSPGPLSNPHAFLEENCAACHTGGKGVESAKCIACHANDEALLKRTPTAFHATVGTCVECHAEHQGKSRRPVQMNHAALVHIGLWKLEKAPPDSDREEEARTLLAYLRRHSELKGEGLAEKTLNCVACHATKDVHRELFGKDCAACHNTEKWTIPGYQHPSPKSTSCVQCHQAPPSHYMMHFKMISMKIAGQPFANVTQCYQCHQTTSWNDIKGVGWYKHH